MPRYIIRVQAEVLRDESPLLLTYENLPKYIDVPVSTSTPQDAQKLLAQVLGALVLEVQKGKIILLND